MIVHLQNAKRPGLLKRNSGLLRILHCLLPLLVRGLTHSRFDITTSYISKVIFCKPSSLPSTRNRNGGKNYAKER